MARQVLYCLVCFLLYASPVFSTCWTPRTEDIDWCKMSYRWNAVIDAPTPPLPTGCWNPVNFTETDNGVIWAVADETEGDLVPPTEYFFFKRKSFGVYSMNKFDAESFSATFQLGRLDLTKDEKKLVPEDVDDLAESEWIFLTDYNHYLMFVHCADSDWGAMIKTRTPQTTVEELHMISQALVDNGLHSPTMVLKNECLNTRNKNWNPAEVVIN